MCLGKCAYAIKIHYFNVGFISLGFGFVLFSASLFISQVSLSSHPSPFKKILGQSPASMWDLGMQNSFVFYNTSYQGRYHVVAVAPGNRISSLARVSDFPAASFVLVG